MRSQAEERKVLEFFSGSDTIQGIIINTIRINNLDCKHILFTIEPSNFLEVPIITAHFVLSFNGMYYNAIENEINLIYDENIKLFKDKSIEKFLDEN